MGHVEHESSSAETDRFEATARALVTRCADSDWDAAAVDRIVVDVLGAANPGVSASLTFACREVVPRLRETTREIPMVLHALDGGYVPAGPSGSPLRGLVNVLPTGRNFYRSTPGDPRGWPTRPARPWPSPSSRAIGRRPGNCPSRSAFPSGDVGDADLR